MDPYDDEIDSGSSDEESSTLGQSIMDEVRGVYYRLVGPLLLCSLTTVYTAVHWHWQFTHSGMYRCTLA